MPVPSLRPATVVLLAAVTAVAVAVPAAAREARDGPLPRIEQMGPTSPTPAPDTLEVSPAVSQVRAPADRRVEVRHVLANGLDVPLEVDVEVLQAEVTGDGPRVLDTSADDTAEEPDDAEDDRHAPEEAAGATATSADTATPRLDPPLDHVRLRPGEGAALISTAEADAGQASVLALRATAPDGTSATAYVVVTSDDLDTDVALDLDLAADGRAEVTARADHPTMVDVRLQARSWVGASSDATVADVLVGPEPRRLPISAPAARLPGSVAASAVARSDDGGIWSVSTGRLVLPGLPWVAGLTGLLVVLVLLVRRQRRTTESGSGP